jgi:transcription elongation factor Elf1
MSVFIDRKFLLQVSPRLERFSSKKEDLFNFRCPLCGDSQKNKTKSRGYIYRKSNDYFYMCHNCGVSTSFYNFLKQVDSTLVDEYVMERYRSGDVRNTNYPKPIVDEIKEQQIIVRKKPHLPTIASLSKGHFARDYVEHRKIPEKFQTDLYFSNDFKQFVDSYGIEKSIPENDQRLVIPFYDADNNLVAFQGRALGDSQIRYITIKLTDDNKKIFGLDRVDQENKIFVFEGPIDSMFIENGVATADSHLEAAADVLDKSKIVLVFDNEPRNKEILKQIERAIDNHFNVVIWPDMIVEKDINEMILSGFTSDELHDIIDKHTYQNLRAKMEFINWKKI